jgi:hypothetical protein
MMLQRLHQQAHVKHACLYRFYEDQFNGIPDGKNPEINITNINEPQYLHFLQRRVRVQRYLR